MSTSRSSRLPAAEHGPLKLLTAALSTCRNIAISLLYLAGVTAISHTFQAIGRDRTRMLSYLPL
jgi:hypothetical protein